MRLGIKNGGDILRILALIVILMLLIPKLLAACFGLYKYILNQGDKIPSGNPMKVQSPYPGQGPEKVVNFTKVE